MKTPNHGKMGGLVGERWCISGLTCFPLRAARHCCLENEPAETNCHSVLTDERPSDLRVPIKERQSISLSIIVLYACS